MAGSSPPPSLSDDMIDKFVLSYLRSRGYARAEDVFRQSLSSAGLDELAHSVSVDCHATMLKQVLHGVVQQQQSPDAYAEAFQCLETWIEGSLDMYRTELHAVLFPIFLHVFLDLIAKGFPYDAAAFMERFRKEFEGRHGREILSLQGLHYPEQVEGNATAKRFRQYKVDIVLSAYSHQLLLSFLQESKLYLLLKIINEHINMTVMYAKPLAGAQASAREGALNDITGLTPGEMVSMNGLEVEWGALDEVQALVREATEGDDDRLQPSTPREEPEQVLKKPRLEVATMTSRIPLPPITPKLRAKILSDVEARRKIPADVDTHPTICCFTFLNSADDLSCISLGRGGSLVAAGYSDSSVRVWDLEQDSSSSSSFTSLIGHSGPVFSVAMSSEGRYGLSASEDGSVRLWSLTDRLPLVAYTAHNYPVWDVALSPRDFYFVSGSHDRTARLWSTERIFPLRVFAGHISDVDCVAFHPNSNYVLTGSTDKTMRFWDIQSGNCFRIFRGHTSPIRAVAISPNGQYAAGGDLAGTVHTFDLGSSQLINTFQGHTGPVTSLHWSVDGSQLASGSLDQSVRIWDCNAGSAARTTSSTTAANGKNHVFHTKSTPITTVRYTSSNLLLAGGVFRP